MNKICNCIYLVSGFFFLIVIVIYNKVLEILNFRGFTPVDYSNLKSLYLIPIFLFSIVIYNLNKEWSLKYNVQDQKEDKSKIGEEE